MVEPHGQVGNGTIPDRRFATRHTTDHRRVERTVKGLFVANFILLMSCLWIASSLNCCLNLGFSVAKDFCSIADSNISHCYRSGTRTDIVYIGDNILLEIQSNFESDDRVTKHVTITETNRYVFL